MVPIVRRFPRFPSWEDYCVYCIHYKNKCLYVGRFKQNKNEKLGNPYFGKSGVALFHGWRVEGPGKRERKCDVPLNEEFVDFIECWHCSPRYYQYLESWLIRWFARVYGVSRFALDYDRNSFTEKYYRPDGLLLNCHDNLAQQTQTCSSRQHAMETMKNNGYLDSERYSDNQSKAAKRAVEVLHERLLDTNYYGSYRHLDSCIKAGAKAQDVVEITGVRSEMIKKSLETKRALGVKPVYRKVSVKLEGVWVVFSGYTTVCSYLESFIGIHFCYTSLEKSLKRNKGDTWYKGFHFKYADLLTEDELNNSLKE